MELSRRQQAILELIAQQKQLSISQIHATLNENISIPSLNRDMAALVASGHTKKVGKGRSTAYSISSAYALFVPTDLERYFDTDPDARKANTHFNYDVIAMLDDASLFSQPELRELEHLKQNYQRNIASISPALYQKELERLTIELSWKSSQIEGNTYSLLETERLFFEKQEAEGKSPSEAAMLLNHKTCLNYLLKHKDMGKNLSLGMLEEVHSLLVEDLGISRNIRSRTVGITGTTYKPLDNSHQIKEALESMCVLINAKDNGFEKALLAVVLISYIQPFEDGNKRTARMISNALLISDGACPLSYRSVDSLDYKKAMLLFYEQHNLSAFKQMFTQQIEFAVNNYFQ